MLIRVQFFFRDDLFTFCHCSKLVFIEEYRIYSNVNMALLVPFRARMQQREFKKIDEIYEERTREQKKARTILLLRFKLVN